MFNPKFPLYRANIKIVQPYKVISMGEWLRAIKNSPYTEIFHKIEEASKSGNLKLKATLKKKLFYSTPCVQTDGKNRSYENITAFTGLMPLDFDKLPSEEDAVLLKEYLFNTYPEVVTAFLSPSRLGVKCLVRIPICKSVEEYKSYFYGMAYYLEDIQGFDISCQNPVLPLFLSTDSELLYKDTGHIWRTKGERLNDFYSTEVSEVPMNFKPTEEDKKYIEKWAYEKFSQIYDNGHPQVLSISTTLGGFVGYGYLTLFEAQQIASNGVTMSSYLHKDIKGYQLTAKKAVSYGMQKPLELWTSSKNYE